MTRECQQLDSFLIDGRRYAIEPGRRFTVKGKRGDFKAVRIDAWPDGNVEVLCWWRSSARSANIQAEWRTVQLVGPDAVEVKSVAKEASDGR